MPQSPDTSSQPFQVTTKPPVARATTFDAIWLSTASVITNSLPTFVPSAPNFWPRMSVQGAEMPDPAKNDHVTTKPPLASIVMAGSSLVEEPAVLITTSSPHFSPALV